MTTYIATNSPHKSNVYISGHWYLVKPDGRMVQLFAYRSAREE